MATYRLGAPSAGTRCLGGAAPLFIPFGASVTMTSTLPATVCFVQGSALKVSITAATAAITTVGLYGDGAGSCVKLEPSFGINGLSYRVENVFYPDRQIPGTSGASNVVIQPGRAKGVCADAGGVLGVNGSKVTLGRPCFADAECTGTQTCVLGTEARSYIRGAYVCARGPADASVFLAFEW